MAVASRDSARGPAAEGEDVLARVIGSPWLLAVILVVAFAVFAPTLGDWFTGDDFWFLRASQEHSFGDQLSRSFDVRNTGKSLEFDRYRPLYPIAWHVQHAAFGLHAAYYHVVALALHLACVAVVWMIARRLFAEMWAAHATALIFALHPAYADAVTWISGANRVFAALPYFLALLLFIDARRHDGRSGALLYTGAWASYVAAVLFHSSSLTLVAVLPAYAFLVAGRPRDALSARAWLPFVPFLAVAAVMAGVQYWVREHLGADQAFRFGWHQYGNYGQYLGLALVPIGGSSFPGDRGDVVEGLQGIASVVMIGVTLALLMSRRSAVAAFAIIWFYASLLPDSTLILGAFGRTMYGTGAALALAAVGGVMVAYEVAAPGVRATAMRIAPYAAGATLVALMVVSYQQSAKTSDGAAENERFVRQLRVEGAAVPPGGVLYVVDAPRNLVNFNSSSRLESLVHLYFDDLDVRALPAGTPAAEFERDLGPDDRVLRYQR